MKQESCLTTFFNGEDIVDIGFSEWELQDSVWSPVGENTFVMPDDGNRVIVETPTGCIEWKGGPWRAGGSFTIDGSGISSYSAPFIQCQRQQVNSVELPAVVPPQKMGIIQELLTMLGVLP